jgi:hypothetical protein
MRHAALIRSCEEVLRDCLVIQRVPLRAAIRAMTWLRCRASAQVTAVHAIGSEDTHTCGRAGRRGSGTRPEVRVWGQGPTAAQTRQGIDDVTVAAENNGVRETGKRHAR